MKTKGLILSMICLFAIEVTYAQIYLNNPSLEDVPGVNKAPAGWGKCMIGLFFSPDVQPGFFGVTVLPNHGSSYVGLFGSSLSDNNYTEGIDQALSLGLSSGKQYAVDLYLAKHIFTAAPGEIELRIFFWGGYL